MYQFLRTSKSLPLRRKSKVPGRVRVLLAVFVAVVIAELIGVGERSKDGLRANCRTEALRCTYF